jgi:hypothetical protein
VKRRREGRKRRGGARCDGGERETEERERERGEGRERGGRAREKEIADERGTCRMAVTCIINRYVSIHRVLTISLLKRILIRRAGLKYYTRSYLVL